MTLTLKQHDNAYGKNAVKRAKRWKRRAIKLGLTLRDAPTHIKEKLNVVPVRG